MKKPFSSFKIKAIETSYNGYKFRSRLEARYAVFFDTLGVQYYYEHEGFSLEGVAYLPDFYLPQYDCFVEIKGQEPTEEELDKARLLATYTGKAVHLFAGNIDFPGKNESQIYSFYPPSLWKYLATETLGHASTQKVQIEPEILGLLGRAEYLWLAIEIEKEDEEEKLALKVSDIAAHITWKIDELSDYISFVGQQLRFLKTFQTMVKEREEEIFLAVRGEEEWEYELLQGSEDIQGIFWRECSCCGALVIDFRPHPCVQEQRGTLLHDSPRLMAAYTAARQARF